MICTRYNEAYRKYSVQRNALDARIEMRQARQNRLAVQIEELKKKRDALVFPSWIDYVLRPLAHELEAYLNKRVRIYGPFGLRSEVQMRVYDGLEEEAAASCGALTIVPDFNDDLLELRYDTGRIIRECPPNSIGALNNLGNETLPLPETLPEIAGLLIHRD